MENLDIEKLERKNIYQIPDDVFENMQANVLQETFPEKKEKIINLNWIYSAAAAIALLFGLTFFINNDPKETENATIAQTSSNVETPLITNTLTNDKMAIEQDQKIDRSETSLKIETSKASKTEVESFALARQEKGQTSERVASKNADQTEIPMDQIIASFTSADLADLGKNTEQDVYLDLYN